MVLLAPEVYAKHKCSCEKCEKGGFTDSLPVMSVAQALKLPEDSYVSLQGFITKRIGDDKYSFTDGAEAITLEIDDEIWHGQTVSPKDKISILGEIEHDDGVVNVDVKSLRLVK
jgi:uncharacterized protein (TIGR00156 family)